MNLVIVESPAKAKTINGYLGKDFKVLASLGHIAGLESKQGSVLPDEDFAMHYKLHEKSKEYVKKICESAKKSDVIYLATDPDREGEAIAWHVAQAIKDHKSLKKGSVVKRVLFYEITKKAVTHAINNPRDLDESLINAQQARTALDYLVGFTLSPLLWRKLPGCKSAGRVQSVALRLICDRENEISAFDVEEYWDISAKLFNSEKKPFEAKLVEYNGNKLKKFDITSKDDAQKIVNSIKDNTFIVKTIEKKQQKRTPPPPFITSTLQQEASNKLGFNAKKTMQIAQKLYEGVKIDGETIGLITYMRTDGVTISKDAVDDIRKFIDKTFGSKYLPSSSNIFASKVKNAQEAHEAIRPTDINIEPDSVSNVLDKDQMKLYSLIWQRTLACQMEKVVLDTVSVFICDDHKNTLKANGSMIKFDGFYKAYSYGLDTNVQEKDISTKSKKSNNKEDKVLPILNEQEKVEINEMIPNQHFTSPPPRYTEASIVKKLEELGIGRPSTYASIISVLQERDYVTLDNKSFKPQSKGMIVTAFLIKYFQKYVEYDFTAELEGKLDQIAEGAVFWKLVLKDFWDGFNSNITDVKDFSITDIVETLDKILFPVLFPKKSGDESNEQSSDPRTCNICEDGRLGLRLGKFGAYIGCSNYPKCEYTRQIDIQQDLDGKDDNIDPSNKLLGQVEYSDVFLKKGPYGWYVETKGDDDKPKRVSVPVKLMPIENFSIIHAQKLLSLPKYICDYDGQKVYLNIGKYGPYLKCGLITVPIKTLSDPFSISAGDAMKFIEKKQNILNKNSLAKDRDNNSKDTPGIDM